MKDDLVYHYCSSQSLFEIIRSKELWLTSLNSTNDETELSYGKKILNNLIIEMIEEATDQEFKNYLIDLLRPPADKISQSYHHFIEYFGMSFVCKKDNLTHWGNYGCAGTGFCFSLNLEKLDSYINYDLSFDKLDHEDLIYDEKKQKGIIKDRLLDLYNNAKRDRTRDKGSASIAYTILLDLRPYFKNNCFCDEKEHRLILREEPFDYSEYSSHRYNQYISEKENGNEFKEVINQFVKLYEFQQKLKILPEQRKYGIIKNEIRSYYSLNLEKIWNSELIPEIVIGPKCLQNERELYSFLRDNGLKNTKIIRSAVPTRK